MPNNSLDSRDTNPMSPLGQAGVALASAAAEFLSRAFEISGRRAGEAMAQALGSTPNPASPATWIDSVLNTYRDYLGEMAVTLPLVAQRLSRNLQTGTGDRLLRRIDPATAQMILSELIKIRETDGIWLTEKTAQRVAQIEVLGQVLSSATQPLDTDVAEKLSTWFEGLIYLLDDDRLRDLPKLLDTLKYDFRRDRVAGLIAMSSDLKNLLGAERLEPCFTLLDGLTEALGETVVRELFRKSVVKARAFVKETENEGTTAKDAAKKVLNDPAWPRPFVDQIPLWLAKALRQEFTDFGIELTQTLSLVPHPRYWKLLDHERDLVFEIREIPLPKKNTDAKQPDGGKPASLLEIYGRREGRRYNIDSQRLLLPVRVHEARQGVAVWSLDKRLIQDKLDGDRPFGVHMKAWDIGAGRTPIALFMVEYREGDLGEYFELGLGCFAAPREDPLAVGMYVIAQMPVSTQLACDAGVEIWGYPKAKAKLEIRYRAKEATCDLQDADNGEVIFRLPRGGENSSTSLPLFSYTLKGKSWHRSVITRSGAGETMRGGGSGVELRVSSFGQPKGLADELRYLGIVDKNGNLAQAPMFSAWTEHMSAELHPPAVVVVPEEDSNEARPAATR